MDALEVLTAVVRIGVDDSAVEPGLKKVKDNVFNATQEAERRIARRSQEEEVKKEMDRLTPKDVVPVKSVWGRIADVLKGGDKAAGGDQGAIGQTAKFLADMGGAIGGKVGMVLGGLSKGLAALGPVGMVAAAAVTGVNQALELAGKAFDAFMGVIDIAVKLGSAASPYAAERYELAMRDLNASMGQVFVPVLEVVTKAVRFLADAFLNFLPSQQDMREIIKIVTDSFGDMGGSLKELAPIIKFLITSHLRGLAIALAALIKPIANLIEFMERVPGFTAVFGGGSSDWKSSENIGNFQSRGYTGIDEAIRNIRVEALKVGLEQDQPPTKAQADEQIRLLAEIAAKPIAGQAGAAVGVWLASKRAA